MFNKTTSANYFKFGKVTDSFKKDSENYDISMFTEIDDEVSEMVSYDHDVYIEPMEGMAMMRIAENPYMDTIESFALHRAIQVNKGYFFALVPMSGPIIYNLYIPHNTRKRRIRLETPIRYDHIVPTIRIDEIIAYYYVVKRPNYQFPGEVHRYYELTYVDQGNLYTTVDGKSYELEANQFMIYGPGQFHDQRVTSEASCSYMTVIFKAEGLIASESLNQVFTCSRSMVSTMESFVKATDDKGPYRFDAMVTTLQSFLVLALHSKTKEDIALPTSPINQHFENKLMEEIIDYINHHLYEPLPIDQICQKFSISRSTLQNLFKNNLQTAPKQYINEAKLNRSKILIRKGDRTISEIASLLGFNSIHYFSRKFTQRYGITPSEFSRRIYDQNDAHFK